MIEVHQGCPALFARDLNPGDGSVQCGEGSAALSLKPQSAATVVAGYVGGGAEEILAQKKILDSIPVHIPNIHRKDRRDLGVPRQRDRFKVGAPVEKDHGGKLNRLKKRGFLISRPENVSNRRASKGFVSGKLEVQFWKSSREPRPIMNGKPVRSGPPGPSESAASSMDSTAIQSGAVDRPGQELHRQRL